MAPSVDNSEDSLPPHDASHRDGHTSRAPDLGIRSLAAVGMFSGAALVVHIASGISLRVTLGVATLIVVFAVAARVRRTDVVERAALTRALWLGASGGLVATICYDASRAWLSQLDPSPFNPFETIRRFGELLANPGASASVVMWTGAAFHFLNGTAFGVAFVLLFSRPTVLRGVAWGVFLELVQLSLYPGWLDITFLREFAQISAAGHVVYGATLGTWCSHGRTMFRWRRV